jgi:hypothetical protein
MDCAGHQTRGQTVEANLPATEHNFAHDFVVRQHADDDVAVEQIANVRGGPQTECLKLADPIRAADMGDHLSSLGREVCGHRRSHAAEADKSNFAQRRRAGGQFRNASALAGRN